MRGLVEEYAVTFVEERTVTAPRTAEQAISLLSAGVGGLMSVELTDEERERVWRLIEKALDAVGETR